MMTREEARKHLHDDWYIENGRLYVDGDKKDAFLEATGMAISALRPVSRERVEKVWRAHWNESVHLGGFVYCSRCGYNALEANNYTFCPKCGSPFTDEAVEMVMRRLEALKDDKDM